jgi:predicted RNA-binding Zn-ribbon protein involved in translation (DUF1610 family)
MKIREEYQRKRNEISVEALKWSCPKCGAFNEIDSYVCKNCGWDTEGIGNEKK